MIKELYGWMYNDVRLSKRGEYMSMSLVTS